MLTLRMNLIMKTAQGEHEHDMNGRATGIMQSQLLLVHCLQVNGPSILLLSSTVLHILFQTFYIEMLPLEGWHLANSICRVCGL